MIGYFTRTGTLATQEVLRSTGHWRPLITPDALAIPQDFPGYAIDNGAWGAYTQNKPWNEEAFLRLVERRGRDADFVVLPDIVAGGDASLGKSLGYIDLPCDRVLIPVQDGMNPDLVAKFLSPRVGIFLGGTTEFKLQTASTWGTIARAHGAYYHIGRVNSRRRMMLARHAYADSFDGTGVSRFTKYAEKMVRWLSEIQDQGVIDG